jgi:hypothetical protein
MYFETTAILVLNLQTYKVIVRTFLKEDNEMQQTKTQQVCTLDLFNIVHTDC